MFEQKYKDTFEQVVASPDTLREVLNLKNNRKTKRIIPTLAVAVLLIVVLATSVFAYAGFVVYENPQQMLDAFFGNKELPNQESHSVFYDYPEGGGYEVLLPSSEYVALNEELARQEIGPNIAKVGQSSVWNGYTLTVEAHLHDNATDSGIIYYTLENPAGVSGYSVGYDGEVWWPIGAPVNIVSPGHDRIIPSQTTDTKLSIACFYHKPSEEYPMEVCFVGQQDLAVSLPGSYENQLSYVTSTCGQIVISPIAMQICFENMEFLCLMEDGTYWSGGASSNLDELVIRFTDGTEYVVMRDGEESSVNNTAYIIGSGSAPHYTTYLFNRLVDVNEIEAILLNGVQFSISDEPVSFTPVIVEENET